MEHIQKKKILYVITKGTWGGASRYVFDLATQLPTDQYEVAVALGGPGTLQQKLENAGITVFQMQNIQRDISVATDVGGFFSLYHVMREYRPDVVHLNSSKAGGLGALAARLACGFGGFRTRIIFTVHGWPFEEKRGILWRLFAFLGSWVTALLSHRVIVISKQDFRIGRRLLFCRNKMHLIYNGIALPMHFESGDRIRKAFPAGVHITGTIGELVKNKNHISLIEQAARDPRLYVAIVGEGEERQHLEAKITEYGLADRVKLFGFVLQSDAMKGFDTFAFPSLKEGLPYVLLEAKAAGLPIVANRVGGVPDVLDAPDMSEFTLEHMLEKTLALY